MRRLACLLILTAFAGALCGQESPAPESAPPESPAPEATATEPEATEWPERSVEISFLPPPLEGTLSLGIFDSTGKLVRILHRESNLDDFTIGEDALVTMWDGKNDAGEDLPAGKYSARGFAVADVKIEGMAYFFNDWVTDAKSPRILDLVTVWSEADDLHLGAAVVGNKRQTLTFDAGRGLQMISEELNPPLKCDKKEPIPNVERMVTCDEGKDKTSWVLDGAKPGSPPVVKQFSSSGQILRELAIPPDEPQPVDVASSKKEDKIFLIEKNSSMQRLRGLTLAGTKTEGGQPVSDWTLNFEKKVVTHKNFTIEKGKPVLASAEKPLADKVPVKLPPNPLLGDKRVNVDLAVGFDANGSFLKTAEGLPLRTISETPHLTRVVIAPHDTKALNVFQDDDAVVEQFRVSGLDQIMSFDCGNFELK